MAAQTQLLLAGRFMPTPLIGFIFFATLFLYAAHRIVGLARSRPFTADGRYAVIARFRSHIVFYALIAGLCAGIFALRLPLRLLGWSAAPCLVAALYVAPLWRGLRLRDLPFVKIFLIALAWSWITVALPAVEAGLSYAWPAHLMVLERAAFIFAITLPFDIRDMKIDAYNGVKTLPSALGARASQRLAGLALLLMFALAALNYYLNAYSLGQFAALTASAALSGVLVFYAEEGRPDYYYTGLLDGMMVVQFVFIALAG